jgi:hypothetical protein
MTLPETTKFAHLDKSSSSKSRGMVVISLDSAGEQTYMTAMGSEKPATLTVVLCLAVSVESSRG